MSSFHIILLGDVSFKLPGAAAAQALAEEDKRYSLRNLSLEILLGASTACHFRRDRILQKRRRSLVDGRLQMAVLALPGNR
jgi:hypothetical protein